jgi:hypothetical protein
VDVEAHGIAAEEGGSLFVRELDAMVPDHEEGLRSGREQSLGIEAGDRRGWLLLDHLVLSASSARMQDGRGER